MASVARLLCGRQRGEQLLFEGMLAVGRPPSQRFTAKIAPRENSKALDVRPLLLHFRLSFRLAAVFKIHDLESQCV
jgi:hypothetical protein